MNNRQLANQECTQSEFIDVIEAPIEQKLLRSVTYFIILSLTALILWSVFTTVEEVAKAKGSVVPLGHRQVIQSKLGGTIESVLVEEGELVSKGQVLVHFVETSSRSAKDELQSERASLIMKLERLDAFTHQREADFTTFDKNYPNLVIHNHRALDNMNRELAAIKKSSASEIEKTKAELYSTKNLLPSLKRQVTSANKTVKMMDKLVKTGSVSRIKRLEEIQKLNAHKRELEEMKGKQKVLSSTLNNLNDQFDEKKATLIKNLGEVETEVQEQLLKVESRLIASSSTLSQNTVTSPVAGIVQSIPTTSAGSVIPQSGTVAVIVPTTKTALLEAKISPRDIGFVIIGEPARVKIDAFDYSRYGALEGIVKKISPTTDADQTGGVFYKVQISIEKPYFGNDPEKFNLIPGMTGEADIVTGKKTIFQYLWKPVFTNITNAFGER